MPVEFAVHWLPYLEIVDFKTGKLKKFKYLVQGRWIGNHLEKKLKNRECVILTFWLSHQPLLFLILWVHRLVSSRRIKTSL